MCVCARMRACVCVCVRACVCVCLSVGLFVRACVLEAVSESINSMSIVRVSPPIPFPFSTSTFSSSFDTFTLCVQEKGDILHVIDEAIRRERL